MEIHELRFQAIKEAQTFVSANKEVYEYTIKHSKDGVATAVVKIADFMLAYAMGTHKEHLEERQNLA